MSSGFIDWSVDDAIPDVPIPTLPPNFELGALVDEQFELLELIGTGGFGLVFRALDRGAQRPVALKILHASASPELQARFRREGQLAASLDHPGVVRVHRCGEHAGEVYLVYELVQGCRNLDQWARDAPPSRVVATLVEVARAVGAAHALGIVHRDLKPHNVLVDREGRARVSDFGMARGEGLSRLTQTGAMVGTPGYMSPEQWTGQKAGPPADVWALGVILYEALAGELPFSGHTVLEFRQQVIGATPTPIQRHAPSVPAAVWTVCRRALSKLPADRFATATEFADALERAADAEGRRPGGGGAGLLGAGLLGAGLLVLGVALGSGHPAPTERSEPTATRAPQARGLEGWLLPLAQEAPLDEVEARLPGGGAAASAIAPALAALRARPRDMSTLRACLAPVRSAVGARLLRAAERDLAFLERSADPLALAPLKRLSKQQAREAGAQHRLAREGLSADLRRARAMAHLRDAEQLRAAPDSRVERALLRLLGTAAPRFKERLAGLSPADPWRCVLEAELALERGGLEEAQRALERAGPLSSPRLQRRLAALRGRVALARGRYEEAITGLEAAGARLEPSLASELAKAYALAGRADAERVAQLAERLREPRRAEAARTTRVAARGIWEGRPPGGALQDLAAALALDPGSPFTAFYRGLARAYAGERLAGLREAVAATIRAPQLAYGLQFFLLQTLQRGPAEGAPWVEGWGASFSERVGRAFVLTALVEFSEGGARHVAAALELWDGLLAEDPSLWFAWTWRGLLQLRAGHPARAARDFAVAREAQPSCPTRAFYEALLLGAREAPRAQVLKALAEAHQRGFHLWAPQREYTTWSLESYPELERYEGLREALRRRSPKPRRPWVPPALW